MDYKTQGFVYTLYFLGICRSQADLLIKVMNSTCGETYDIAMYDKITLHYTSKENVDNQKPCMFAIVNNRTDREICVKGLREEYTWLEKLICGYTFRYFIGRHVPYYLSLGFSCSDLSHGPLCTNKSMVYAVFPDEHISTLASLKVQIYWRNISESRLQTTTMTATRRITPHNWYDDIGTEADDNKVSMKNLGAAILVTIVGCTIIAISYLVYKNIGNDRETETPMGLPLPRQLPRPDDPSLRRPEYTEDAPSYSSTDCPSLRRPGYTEDAPSYSSVMQQQHVPTSEENINEQGHSNVNNDEALTLVSARHTVDNQALSRAHLETNPTLYEQGDNQINPPDPPPDYADVVPPPPYPGY